ncbi:MAG: hypothetical protein GY866_29270 [Proteobacteria bacterium]|nr:hypothetical protein [Pseudomonadota bacterium]
MTVNTKTAEQLPKLTILGYGVGAIPVNLSMGIVMLYLSYFHTDVFLISPAVVAILFISCRIWDGITDPIMGTTAAIIFTGPLTF